MAPQTNRIGSCQQLNLHRNKQTSTQSVQCVDQIDNNRKSVQQSMFQLVFRLAFRVTQTQSVKSNERNHEILHHWLVVIRGYL